MSSRKRTWALVGMAREGRLMNCRVPGAAALLAAMLGSASACQQHVTWYACFSASLDMGCGQTCTRFAVLLLCTVPQCCTCLDKGARQEGRRQQHA